MTSENLEWNDVDNTSNNEKNQNLKYSTTDAKRGFKSQLTNERTTKQFVCYQNILPYASGMQGHQKSQEKLYVALCTMLFVFYAFANTLSHSLQFTWIVLIVEYGCIIFSVAACSAPHVYICNICVYRFHGTFRTFIKRGHRALRQELSYWNDETF